MGDPRLPGHDCRRHRARPRPAPLAREPAGSAGDDDAGPPRARPAGARPRLRPGDPTAQFLGDAAVGAQGAAAAGARRRRPARAANPGRRADPADGRGGGRGADPPSRGALPCQSRGRAALRPAFRLAGCAHGDDAGRRRAAGSRRGRYRAFERPARAHPRRRRPLPALPPSAGVERGRAVLARLGAQARQAGGAQPAAARRRGYHIPRCRREWGERQGTAGAAGNPLRPHPGRRHTPAAGGRPATGRHPGAPLEPGAV